MLRRRFLITVSVVFVVLVFIAVVSLSYLKSINHITVTVRNVGMQTLSSVVLVTTEDRYELGDIGPDGAKKLDIRPTRDTDLVIVSDAGRSRVDTYMSRGYVGELTVKVAGLKVVDIEDNLRIGW